MNYIPKNIIKGRTSSGETFTLREWDFVTLATLETIGFFWVLIPCIILSSIAGPLLLVISLLGFTGRFNMIYFMILALSGYFLFDCYQGWVSLGALNLVFEEETINKIVYVNAASFIITIILILFGGFFGKMITKPISKLDDSVYESMSNNEKRKLDERIGQRKYHFLILMVFLYFVVMSFIKPSINLEKGWVNSSDKESTFIPYEDRLTPKEKKEREEYFEKIEKRWGN